MFPTTVEVRVNGTDERQARERIRVAFEAGGVRWSDEMIKGLGEVRQG